MNTDKTNKKLLDFSETFIRNNAETYARLYGPCGESKIRILIEVVKLEIAEKGIADLQTLENFLEGDFRESVSTLLCIQ